MPTMKSRGTGTSVSPPLVRTVGFLAAFICGVFDASMAWSAPGATESTPAKGATGKADPAGRVATPPFPVAQPGSRLPVAVVVERVQKRYDAAQDFRARFNQTLNSVVLKRKSQSTGEVLLKKPGLMRWNYEQPDPKMYLSDGNMLWLYEPEDKQAFKQNLKTSQLPAALSFLLGTGKLAEQFDITFAPGHDANAGASVTGSKTGASPAAQTFGTARDYVLALSPKQASAQIKSLLFVVDSETFDVRETVIIDGQGNQNDVLFSDIRTNTKIPATTFRWSPPAGVRLIDTAKMGR